MTRAVIIGFACVAFLSTIAYFNDDVLKQSQLIGNHMPVSVFGGLIIFTVLVNTLLYRLRKSFALKGPELALIVAMVLAVCCIPAGGLMRNLPGMLVYPHHQARTELGWKENKIMEAVPPKMLVDPSIDESKVINGYVQGMAIGEKHISFRDIPWQAWTRTLGFWIPFLLVLWVGLLGLSLVLHRQWADHEHLPYPIASFANTLMPDEGKPAGGIFQNRIFWLGTGVVLFIHLVNYTYEWFPNSIQIPRSFDLSRLAEIVEPFFRGGGGYLLRFTIYFTAVAIAYLIPSGISLSIGLGPFFFRLIRGLFIGYGINIYQGTHGSIGGASYLGLSIFGACLGIGLFIVYNGRFFYKAILRQALFLEPRENANKQQIWGARIFSVSMILILIYLMTLGIESYIAVLLLLGILLAYVVQARIVSETGLHYSDITMALFLLPLFGPQVLGPAIILPMLLLTTLLFDGGVSRESFMPFIMNSLRLLNLQKVKLGKPVIWMGASLIVAVFLALPMSLYFHYDRGQSATWPTNYHMPKQVFSSVNVLTERLIAQDKLEDANNMSGLSRIAAMTPDPASMLAIGLGLGFALAFTIARLRIPGWPLHPIMFILWSFYPTSVMAVSFLLGWLLKTTVTKYAGEAGFQKLKPLMFGLIAGDVLGGIIPAIIGIIYHLITGELPKAFMVTA